MSILLVEQSLRLWGQFIDRAYVLQRGGFVREGLAEFLDDPGNLGPVLTPGAAVT